MYFLTSKFKECEGRSKFDCVCASFYLRQIGSILDLYRRWRCLTGYALSKYYPTGYDPVVSVGQESWWTGCGKKKTVYFSHEFNSSFLVFSRALLAHIQKPYVDVSFRDIPN
jgi:hypothetical protein